MRAAVCAASFSSSTPFYYPPTAKTKPSSAVFLSFVTPFPALPLPSLLFASNSPPRSAYAAKKSPPADTASNKRSVGKRTPDRPPADVDSVGLAPAGPAQLRRDRPPPLPKPPAGFLLDQNRRVINVASKRTATLVDPDNNLPLECVIRRAFQSSKGDECMLLYPLDKPIQILKSANFSGWSAVNDEDVQSLIPAAAYALAKIHMHLVLSGFCYTARGGFCYSEEDVLQFGTDDDQSVEGLPAEGVEITCFNLDGAHYMIYTPSDPLLFVAVKDENGVLRIADDDLLEDPCIVAAIDEETEFNALVEEEAALLESLLEE